MLQYNRKQYNPHTMTTEANLKRHWFYAAIFEKNPDYKESVISNGENNSSSSDSDSSATDEETSNMIVDEYAFCVTLFENSPNGNYFWQFNVDQCYDALVVKHNFNTTDVEAYIWLDHPIHKRLYYEHTCPDEETTIIKFYKGKLPPGTIVDIKLRKTVSSTTEIQYTLARDSQQIQSFGNSSSNVSSTTSTNTTSNINDVEKESEKPTVALLFRAGTLEGLYQILETIDEEYWKSDNDDYVAHTIRDYRGDQDIKVMIYYKNDLNKVIQDIGEYYKIVKTWID